ncbi:nickel pincer cofactor biosynthesis protein LarC [Desulfosporosinus sp. PR]|uniref:nickel pincer cofactor biosynthesis protein LarC n=1 Tax=Candidatus Desulfosporosinus nitrosoreducens TaxID=3401928 RepID=UPI0027EB403B|nr:nickel pincer cofactor biosynthesis protein LarC [Desulfosporosinus sp. PR]MDQ7096486.1 nickel pincer cofactor biosynthesis protein LarC [Desulfosporosinus sp. PR]
MKKVLYYDCFCGISGDMNLGALLDLGVEEDYLIHELAKLNLDAEYELQVKKDNKLGITGTRVDVLLKVSACQEPDKHHTHHAHRNLRDIETIIANSSLNNNVKKLSLAIFMKVAEAEAKVHGKLLDEVHFHEVGAVDSIIDIVGAAVCLDYLSVDKIMASSVQVGGGFVKCAHGIIPVPAPATVEILKDIPVKSGIVPFETTTPTGAAILAANVAAFTDHMDFSIEKTGYGIGHRELEIPNVLRIYLGCEDKEVTREEQYILETNIDDMNPELYGYVEEKLFAQGALDVFKTAITMKKGRAATKLSVLVNEEKEKSVLDIIFRETTSIGVRKYQVEKIMLPRDFEKVSTQYGDVTIKNAYYQGEKVKYKPEYEDCRRIALEKNIPITRVYQEVSKMMENDKLS